jgi:hypothetical protein
MSEADATELYDAPLAVGVAAAVLTLEKLENS